MKLFNFFKKGKSSDNSENCVNTRQNSYNISKLSNGDKVAVAIFNETKQLEIFSSGDSKFDENGNYRDIFEFNQKEIELLNWILNNIKLESFANEITKYCNDSYEMIGDKKINKEDLPKEINITAIAINVSKIHQSKSGFVYPEIAFYGECKCDPEHGICIGFRNKEFLGVFSQDWIL